MSGCCHFGRFEKRYYLSVQRLDHASSNLVSYHLVSLISCHLISDVLTDVPESRHDDPHLGHCDHQPGDPQQPEGHEVHHQVLEVEGAGDRCSRQQLQIKKKLSIEFSIEFVGVNITEDRADSKWMQRLIQQGPSEQQTKQKIE